MVTFWKFQGAENDFIVVDRRESTSYRRPLSPSCAIDIEVLGLTVFCQ